MSQGRDLLDDDERAQRGARGNRARPAYWPRSLDYQKVRPGGIDAARSRARARLCLVPGLVAFLGYALYPRMIDRLDLLNAVARWFGPSESAVRIAGNADTLLLILGIALSAICWHFTEQARERQRH